MSQGRSPEEEEDMHELIARLEREFKPRGELPPDPPTYRDPAAAAPNVVPQRVRLTLPMTRPRAVFALLAINVIMYVITAWLASRVGFTMALYILGAKENSAINQGQWWRLLTPMVLHGGLTHLLFNSWALYALGVDAERMFGTTRFLTIYLLAGLAGSIASYVFNPAALSVGASGAIFGLFSALAAFSFTSRSLIGWEASKMQLGQIATLVVINLALGFAIPNIDNSAHIGGLIAGGIVGLALAPRYVIERRSYMPTVERRDPPLTGWAVALIVLVGLIAWFIAARFGFGF